MQKLLLSGVSPCVLLFTFPCNVSQVLLYNSQRFTKAFEVRECLQNAEEGAGEVSVPSCPTGAPGPEGNGAGHGTLPWLETD